MHTAHDVTLQDYAHLMLEYAPVGMALFDAPELCLLAANPCFQLLLEPQWQQGHAIGQPLTEILPGAELSPVIDLFRSVVQTGAACQTEAYAFSIPERGMTYWSWMLAPIHEHGQVGYVLLTATEVTSQVLARQHAEQAYATLARANQTLEKECERLEHTKAILLSLQGMSEPKALAKSVLTTFDRCYAPDLLAFYSTHPEHDTLSLLASHFHADSQQAAPVFPAFLAPPHGGAPLQAIHQRAPIIMRQSQNTIPDGSWERDALLALPATQCVVYLPLWGESCEGVLVAAFASEEAVSELLMRTLSECAPYVAEALAAARLQMAMADARQRLHTILDQLPEGVLLVEAMTSKVSYANPAAAQLLGLALSDLVGVPLNQSALLSQYGLFRQNQMSAFRWNFALIHALWGKTSTNQELSVTRPDGSEIVVLSSAAPIRTTNGLTSEAVIVFQDITPLKQLEQQKNTFFAVANHELRTPLTVIMGFAEILQLRDTEEADARYQYAVTSIMQECEHLTRLIHDLLDVSLLEQGQLDLQRNYQDLLAPLQPMIHKRIHTARKHRLHLTLEELESTDHLMGYFDLRRIEQILDNLITNAIKYSPAGGEIEIGVRSHRDTRGTPHEVVIRVKDQGIGIAAENLPRLFERFYRADTQDQSISGFGIGLYLTRELVQGHGGRIWVESVPGQGSTFFVVLPLGETLQAFP